MSDYSAELNCPFCGIQLNGYEIEYIQKGTSVRCTGCGTILSKDTFQSTEEYLIERPISPQGLISPKYQTPPRRRSGALVFFIGFIILSLGLYSWVFYIPIFNEFIFGEILGAIAVVKGIVDLRTEAVDPSGIRIMMVGLLLWIAAWLSWFVYIPVLSLGYVGEFGGFGLIVFGYWKSRPH